MSDLTHVFYIIYIVERGNYTWKTVTFMYSDRLNEKIALRYIFQWSEKFDRIIMCHTHIILQTTARLRKCDVVLNWNYIFILNTH